MVDLINRDRGVHGLPSLALDPSLSAIAKAHSQDMRDSGYFAHVSPSAGDLSQRLHRAGYGARFSAENIARSTSLFEATESLMQSLGHRANILSREAQALGVGVVLSEGGLGSRPSTSPRTSPDPSRPSSPAELRGQLPKSH